MTTAVAKRVSVREATSDDVSAAESWHGGPASAGDAFAFCRRDGGDLAVMTWARRRGNTAEIVQVVVCPELRGLGYGTEAIELLEAEYPGCVFVARVGPADGLNLYFWLRLGYRPARAGEVPPKVMKDDDTMVMIRGAGGPVE